ASPDLLQWLDGEIGRVRNILTTAPPSDRRALIQRFMMRIDLAHGKLSLSLDLASLRQLLIEQRSDWKEIAKRLEGAKHDENQTAFERFEAQASTAEYGARHPPAIYQLALAYTLRQRGVE